MDRLCKLAAGLLFLAVSAYPGTYIVTLGPGPAEAAPAKGEQRVRAVVLPPARTRRAQILIQQNYVRAAIARQTTGEVLDSIDTVGNALIVRIADDQADILRSLPGVAGVYPDKQHRKLLNRAVPLVRGTDAWFLVGGSEFAGAGARIAIIDTGVDQTHPAFQDPQMRVPDGFPKGNKAGDLAYTNSKVIVARSYDYTQGLTPPDPVDTDGHGTAVAATAAAGLTFSPLGLISGVAPKAHIGNYKVFPSASSAAIFKAIDDAVKDGMDVINLSLGSALAERSADNPIEAQAIANAAAAGVLVVAAAGNYGPDPNTISDYAVPADSIAVGATFNDNDHTYNAPLTLAGVPPYTAVVGFKYGGQSPVSGPLFDVARLDPSGLACGELPGASLSGRVALILRGTCTFETKFLNAAAAGAGAAVVYTSPEREIGGIAPGSATLPAVMISNSDGIDIKARLAQAPDINVTVAFSGVARAIDPNTLASFSSVGPSADMTIKPDLVAVGLNVYMPVLRADSGAADALFDRSGYDVASGTSFSSPLVAGAAALVKAARRGLTARQYRSLLINSARSFVPTAGPAGVQQTGSGMLNVANAVETPVAVYPTSLSFGTGVGTFSSSKQLSVGNVGILADTFTISAEPSGGGPAPVVAPNSAHLDPGGSASVTVQFAGSGLAAGVYQGVLIVHPGNGPDARIPYWYAVPSGVPERVTVLDSDESDRSGVTARGAITFRVTDAEGIATLTPKPTVTAIAGSGTVVRVVQDPSIPGAWYVDIVPGHGTNTFRIQAGAKSTDVTITGT